MKLRRRSPKEIAAYLLGFRAGMKHASEIAGKMNAVSVATAITRRAEEQEMLEGKEVKGPPEREGET